MSNYLTKEQVNQLNEKHGWFEFGDAQSDVSMAFAQDAIAMYLAATEAAKATGTAELPPSDGVIEFYEESGRIGRSWTESAWLEQAVREYGQACAEAARQPAPVVNPEVLKEPASVALIQRRKIQDLQKTVTELRAALAATAAPVPKTEILIEALETIKNGSRLDDVGNRNDDGLRDYWDGRGIDKHQVKRWIDVIDSAIAATRSQP